MSETPKAILPHQYSAQQLPIKRTRKGAGMREAGSAIFDEQTWVEIGRSLGLSCRELQIVRGVFDDWTESALAMNLVISPHTVHTHVERLHRKLGVANRVQLILRVITEFLSLTVGSEAPLPPICSRRAAGGCSFWPPQ